MRKLVEGMRAHPRESKAGFLICMMLVSFILGAFFSNPKNHTATLNVIAANRNEAMAITATVTLASTAMTLLPEDYATPLAEELADLSTALMAIVCVLYFEQFMLAPMEYLAFFLLIPFALALRVANLYYRRKGWVILSKKLITIAVLCILVVPVSAAVISMVEAAYAESINALQVKIEEIEAAFNKIIGGDSNGDVLAFVGNVMAGIGSIFEYCRTALGLLIDGVAILMITSCVMPLATFVLFIWGVKSVITGKVENLEDTAMDIFKRLPKRKRKRDEIEEPEERLHLSE